MNNNVCFIGCLSLFIAACGGGGSATPASPVPSVPSPPPEPVGEIFQIETTVLKGQSTELVLQAPNVSLTNISWQQTASGANFLCN
jgi:hypothetical protein